MVEAIFAGAMLAISFRWIGRDVKSKDSFVLYSSRGAFMRELNKKLEHRDH